MLPMCLLSLASFVNIQFGFVYIIIVRYLCIESEHFCN